MKSEILIKYSDNSEIKVVTYKRGIIKTFVDKILNI